MGFKRGFLKIHDNVDVVRIANEMKPCGVKNLSSTLGYINIYIYIYILNHSLEKIQLESKLDFAFVSFPCKLNCLDFCYYFFSELMSIFFIQFLFRYLYAKILHEINCNWAERSHIPIPIQFKRYYLTNLLFYFVLYLVEFHRQ